MYLCFDREFRVYQFPVFYRYYCKEHGRMTAGIVLFLKEQSVVYVVFRLQTWIDFNLNKGQIHV